MDDQRGVIRNRVFANQVRDFRNLRFGNITPTDIDGAIEYHNKCYVYIETKHQGAELPDGQRIFLERQCDDMSKVKPTISIVSTHCTDKDIDVGNTIVSKYRYCGKWRAPKTEMTTRDMVTKFFKMVNEGLWTDGQ